MFTGVQEYRIAWVLPSSGQQAVARHYFDDDIVNYYSSTRRVTYTFGRVEQHNVVMASPASNAEIQSTDYIIEDLLHHVPAIRAGFLVNSDAVAPRAGIARVGDVVIGGTSPNMERGVLYLDAEKEGKEKRIRIIGASQTLPAAVVKAVREVMSPECHKNWQKRPSQNKFTFEMRSVVNNNNVSRPEYLYGHRRQALIGVIASSKQPIEDTALLEKIVAERDIICFGTEAATMCSYPFLVVAGISKYCDNVQSKDTCNAIMSYLTCLIRRLEHCELKREPPIDLQFRYEPIDLGSRGFRLLRLQGGLGELECQMFNASFDDETLVPYEALSYCWGDNRLTHTIRVNGKALAITHNLYTALMHLRFNEKDRMLWIDAVCIDQGNVQERGHQVDHMGDVYRHADQVLFWLGRVEDNVGTLMDALNYFEENIPSEAWEQWPNGDSRFHHIWSKICKRRHFHDLRWELRSLIDDDWFNRVWIIQEVFNAKRASVGCTDGWVSPRAFALAPSLLQVRPSNQCQAIIDIMPGPLRKSSWWNQNPNLSTLLWKFRESQATDSRDRVFALLGIASDKPFRSDYSKSEMIVVKNVFEYLCRDNFPINSMRISSIEDLQNTVPSLVYMGLDQFVSPGTHMDVMKQFRDRHNKQVFLSEAAVGYLWHINSPLKEQLTHESGIAQVVVGQISAKNIPTRSTESLSAYLEQERGQNAIQGAHIPAQENDFDFEYMMLESGRDDIQLTRILALEAARNGSNVFERFLHNNGEQVVLSSDVIAAADNRGLNILDLLLCRHYGQISITDALLVYAIRSHPETLRMFLDRYRHQARVTETAVLEAITAGPETLEVLLDACREPFGISPSVVEADIQHESDTFRALLDEYGNPLEIDSEMVNAAFQKGAREFKVLIDRYGDQITCTDEMIFAAIRQKSNTLKYLVDRYGDQITCTAEMVHVAIHEGSHDALEVLPGRYRDRTTCTNEMIVEAVHRNSNNFARLLDRYGDQITCTAEIVIAAMHKASYRTVTIFFNQFGDQIACTAEMLYALIGHAESYAVGIFLDRYGDQIAYTVEMVYAAIDHGEFWTLVALLDRYGDQIDIKSIATRALYHSSTPKKLKLLLDRYGDRVKVPADAINHMVQFEKVDNLRMLLDRCGDRDDVLKALIRVEDKWAFRRHAARTLIVQGRMNVYPWFRVLASALGDALGQRFRPLAMPMSDKLNELNELLLDPSLLL